MAEDQKLQKNNIILYEGEEGTATIEVLFKDDIMWSTQKQWQNCLMLRYLQFQTFKKYFFQRGTR